MNRSFFFIDRQWDIKKQSVDQLAHAIVGALILLPVLLIDSLIIGCALSSLVCGVIREVEQYAKSVNLHLFDRVLDSAFFGVGGALVGYLVTLWAR